MKKTLASVMWIVTLMLSTFFVPVVASDAATSTKSEKNVSFLWSFATLRGDADALEPVTPGLLRLDPGDTARMMLEPLETCFIYVVLKESNGEMHLLYPDSTADETARFAEPAGKPIYIPQEGWFSVDDEAGAETVYLLASATRLTELERLIEEYATGLGNRDDRAKQIVAHIVDLRRKHWNPQSLEEKPAMIAGKTRGGGNRTCVACLATEISAANFFTRTFTIEHFGREAIRVQNP